MEKPSYTSSKVNSFSHRQKLSSKRSTSTTTLRPSFSISARPDYGMSRLLQRFAVHSCILKTTATMYSCAALIRAAVGWCDIFTERMCFKETNQEDVFRTLKLDYAKNFCQYRLYDRLLAVRIDRYGSDILHQDKKRYYSPEFKVQIISILLIEHQHEAEFKTSDELRRAIEEYIVFYNTRRIAEMLRLQGLTPVENRCNPKKNKLFILHSVQLFWGTVSFSPP